MKASLPLMPVGPLPLRLPTTKEKYFKMILPITGKVGDFVDGELVTGQTSGAKGIAATHLLRCQNLVNPSGIVVPVKFKAVFEPAGIPPPEAGIALTGVEGTFQDGETVVGGTSGATATVETWQNYTLSRVPGNNIIRRYYTSAEENDYEDAKAGYAGDPSYTIYELGTHDLLLEWMSALLYIYYSISGRYSYASFNTTSISEVQTAQILLENVFLPTIDDPSPIMCIYKHDFGESLDSGDWTGGTLIAERAFTSEDHLQDVTIELDPSDVTPGDYSRYRFAWKRTVDQDFWLEAEVRADNVCYAEGIKLKLSAR